MEIAGILGFDIQDWFQSASERNTESLLEIPEKYNAKVTLFIQVMVAGQYWEERRSIFASI